MVLHGDCQQQRCNNLLTIIMSMAEVKFLFIQLFNKIDEVKEKARNNIIVNDNEYDDITRTKFSLVFKFNSVYELIQSVSFPPGVTQFSVKLKSLMNKLQGGVFTLDDIEDYIFQFDNLARCVSMTYHIECDEYECINI